MFVPVLDRSKECSSNWKHAQESSHISIYKRTIRSQRSHPQKGSVIRRVFMLKFIPYIQMNTIKEMEGFPYSKK